MTEAVLVVTLIVGPLTAYAVVLTLPRWFARSLHGHRLWRLRDALVDQVLDGDLPKNHPAIQQLIATMDAVLDDKHVSLMDVYIVKWACRDADPAFVQAQAKAGLRCPLDGLDAKERELVTWYRERFQVLIVGSMLLGSWFGIAHIVPFVPAGMAAAMRKAGVATKHGIKQRLEGFPQRAFGHDLWAPAREATDLAASRSRVGQQAAVFAARYEVAQLAKHDAGESASHMLSSSRR
jgi:hypothetical protein